MAYSLLAHLYSRIRGSQEDVATIALQYLVSKSAELNKAFTKLLASRLDISLEEKLQYICQSVGDDNERPDMAGVDSNQCECILCEMKFYAGLTPNQPLGYLERLKKEKRKRTGIRMPQSETDRFMGKTKSPLQRTAV